MVLSACVYPAKLYFGFRPREEIIVKLYLSLVISLLFSVYKNCAEIYQLGIKINGVYKINPGGLGEFEVYCDQKTAGGGWTVFQKRQDGSVDFYRPWDDYKRGVGNLNGEFWLGLDKIHRLTVSGSYKLRVDLEDLHGSTAFAEYSSFAVTSERAKYQLSLGSYSGTSWTQHYHTGWRSGEGTRLPPMWPGFKSRRRRHMWVEFVVGSPPCYESVFSPGTPVFPSPQKSTPHFNSIWGARTRF